MLRIATPIAAILTGCIPTPGGFSDAPPVEGPVDIGFSSPRAVTIEGYDDDAMEPFLSRDGQYLLFNNRNDTSVDTNLHFARRVDDLTFSYAGPLVGANSHSLDGVPSMDLDGNLMFVSPRSYDDTRSTIYGGRFADGEVSDVGIVPGLSRVEALVVNFDVEVSATGNTVYFVDGRFDPDADDGAPPDAADLVIAERTDAGYARRIDSAELTANINSSALEYAAAISPDELELLFDRVDLSAEGAMPTIYRSIRSSVDEPFGIPSRVDAASGFVEGATFSPDGRAFYYHALVDGRFSIFRVDRLAP